MSTVSLLQMIRKRIFFTIFFTNSHFFPFPFPIEFCELFPFPLDSLHSRGHLYRLLCSLLTDS